MELYHKNIRYRLENLAVGFVLFLFAVLCVYPVLYVLFASFSDPMKLAQHTGLLWKPLEFTLEGYKVDAVRYILKNNVNFSEQVYECMDAISMKMNYVVQKKTFNFNEGTRNISLERLLYIESRLHKLEFHIMEDKLNRYSLYGTLNDMERELADDAFVRIHQSYLVNMKYIVNVSRYKAELNNGVRLEIPKARYRQVEETFVAYRGEL